MVQFDPDHLFLVGLSSLSGPWSAGGFTPVILVQIKLKSQKVRTKRKKLVEFPFKI